MRIAMLILVALIAALHLYIAGFEIFAWESRGPKVFTSLDPELFEKTVTLAANQGLYNGFLAAGLIWSLLIRNRVWQLKVAACFLIFVLVAGLFGAFTTSNMRILALQAAPAAIALALLVMCRRADRA